MPDSAAEAADELFPEELTVDEIEELAAEESVEEVLDVIADASADLPTLAELQAEYDNANRSFYRTPQRDARWEERKAARDDAYDAWLQAKRARRA